jgi:hypothetical protein
MNQQTFVGTDGLELIVKHRRSAVIFEVNPEQAGESYKFNFRFSPDVFTELLEYIETVSEKSWSGFAPKEENSISSDYGEYYDRPLDNNGYLSLLDNGLRIQRPTSEHQRIYKFSKPKMQAFIYDFRKKVNK